ncbi:hypothetical protein MASR1M90_21100 [Desulfovibrionales bacterium]
MRACPLRQEQIETGQRPRRSYRGTCFQRVFYPVEDNIMAQKKTERKKELDRRRKRRKERLKERIKEAKAAKK